MTRPRASSPELFKALAHPARLAVLHMLRGGERCVCEIEAELGRRQAYVSQQLAVLRNAGLVDIRRDGWRVYYRATRPDIYGLIDAARAMADEPRGVRPVHAGAPRPKERIAC